MKTVHDLNKDELLDFLKDAAINWLTHDGLWFRAVEDRFGLEAALELDKQAWEKFTVTEARRIMKRLKMEPGGGIPALVQALQFRLYARINIQEVAEASDSRCVFRMKTCRVQEARQKQGLPDFPCKTIGIIEYSLFAQTIDPRIQTICLQCPPDQGSREAWCIWEFRLKTEK